MSTQLEAQAMHIKNYMHHNPTKSFPILPVFPAILDGTLTSWFPKNEILESFKFSRCIGPHIQLITKLFLLLQYFTKHILAISVIHECNE